MAPLNDGMYEVIVVDAEEDSSRAAHHIELVVTAGQHKGEVVRLEMTNFDRDALSLLGLPGTLTVVDGTPSFAPD
jgi:hypothetical protein